MEAHRKAGLKARLVATTCGAVVVAMAAGGVAYASGSPSATAPRIRATASAPASLAPLATGYHWLKDIRELGPNVVHLSLIARTAYGYRSVSVDRGRLTSVTDKEITIRRADGPSVAATVTKFTKFFGLPSSELLVGDWVVMAQTRGNALDVYAHAPKTTTTTAAG